MRRSVIMIVLALGAGLAAPALAQQDQPQAQPSLADVAKQDKKPAHVLTEDDLKSPSSSSDAAAATTDQDQNQDKDKDKETAAAKDPEDKRTDVQKAEDEVKKWKGEEDTLNRKLARVQEQAANEQSEFRKQMFLDAYNNQQSTLQDLRAKREAAEKNLAAAKEKQQEQGGADNSQGAQEQPPQQPPQEQPPQ